MIGPRRDVILHRADCNLYGNEVVLPRVAGPEVGGGHVAAGGKPGHDVAQPGVKGLGRDPRLPGDEHCARVVVGQA